MTICVITNDIPDCVSDILDASEDYFEGLRRGLFPSRSARELLDVVDTTPLVVGVALVESADGCSSMYVPPTQDLLGVAPTFTGGIVVVNMTTPLVIGPNKLQLPLTISLAHELGHAAQYITNPIWFMDLYKQANTESALRMRRGSEAIWGTGGNPEMPLSSVAMLTIENTNVAMWESPICSDLELPYRKNYES